MVCTGNICRSPAMHYLAQRDWGDAVEVTSAGTHAEIGMDADRQMRRAALAVSDLTIPRHRPAQLDSALIAQSDLVLVATRRHLSWARSEADAGTGHIFALNEAADLTAVAASPAGDSGAERLANAAAALDAARTSAPVPVRDIDDPWALDDGTFQRVMGEIEDAIRALGAWAECGPHATR